MKLLILLLPCLAFADTRIGTILGSKHFYDSDNGKEHNEEHWPSLYVQHNGWTGGTYKNSEDKQSNMIFYEKYFDYGFSGSIGLVDGYEEEMLWLTLNFKLGPVKTWHVPTSVSAWGLEGRIDYE